MPPDNPRWRGTVRAGRQATVAALTGYGEARDRARALSAGFDELLVKPLAAEDLQRFLGGHAPRA